jgi:hypothetical protein
LEKLPPVSETRAVICKNPFCMRIFTIPSNVVPEGTAKVRLTCPGCKHEHEYKEGDFHPAEGPTGTALNPV